MDRLVRLASVFVLLAAMWCPSPAGAQQPAAPDTARVYDLEPVVVTADRSAQVRATSVAAVSVVRAEELQVLPVLNLADVLQLTPGFTFVNLDGAGYHPQPIVRGFYGGGEAEYVVLMLNGRPLNEVERGLINWNLVPLAGLDAVEVLRGGASSLYGDAAIGGVINLVSRVPVAPVVRAHLEGGSYESFRGEASVGGPWRGRPVSAFGAAETVDGYRHHGARRFGSAGATAGLVAGRGGTLSLATLHHWQDYDEPGPLTGPELDAGRRVSSPFYRFDHTVDRTHRLSVDGLAALAPAAQLSAYVSGEVRQTERRSTLVLAPVFADTKDRVVGTGRVQGSAQLTLERLPLAGRLVAGVDASAASLETEYYGVLMGDPDVYGRLTPAEPGRGALAAKGAGRRRMAAPFFQLDAYPAAPLRLSVGGRFDYLRDTFTPEAPSTGDRIARTHTAFSPKAGVNYQVVRTARQAANVYANVSQSFKAATLDQLYDQRTIPVPTEDGGVFDVSLSSADLEPQFGTSYEAGVYHRATLGAGATGTELSLAVYQIDMRNELDFDIQTFRYTNLGKSRHRGVEAGVKLHLPSRVSLFGNYTYQGVTLEYGPNEGNYVKAIPRDAYSAGASVTHRSGLGGSLVVSGASRIFLDDANTLRLPAYTTVDARLVYRAGPAAVHLALFNLLGASYSTTGFPDPAGSGLVYYYPAAGRTVRLGLSLATR